MAGIESDQCPALKIMGTAAVIGPAAAVAGAGTLVAEVAGVSGAIIVATSVAYRILPSSKSTLLSSNIRLSNPCMLGAGPIATTALAA